MVLRTFSAVSALRAHLLGHNGCPVPDQATLVLDRALAASSLVVRLAAPDELQVMPVAGGQKGRPGISVALIVPIHVIPARPKSEIHRFGHVFLY